LIFSIIDESLRKIEPVILSFEKEAQALNNLSMNLSIYEKMDFVRRSHMAKLMMMHFQEDINNKQRFLERLRKKKFITVKMKLLIKFLQGRIDNCNVIMSKSKAVVSLSNRSYEYVVDNGLNE
jgi:hypothetical protein